MEMKNTFRSILGALAIGLCGSLFADGEPAAGIRQIHDFLKAAKCYYIATVDGDQPHVRPFGTILIFENRLYVQTGRKKNVGQQLLANGKVDICAMKDKQVLRVTGTLVEDPRREAKAAMLDAYPGLKKMYSPDDDNTMVLYFKGGTAVVSEFGKPPVTIEF